MYIGSTDSHGLHHLIWEIVDNAVDEALNGFGKKITITLENDGSVTVSDEGRGMPTGKHASGVPTLQVIFTVLHAGGKFTSQGGYKTAGGLHGVGASVVNALSEWLTVETARDGELYRMEFRNGGKKIGKLEKVGTTNRTGSTVRFKPDAKIFSTTEFKYDLVCERAREEAFLLSGIAMTVTDKRSRRTASETYCYDDGLTAYLNYLTEDRTPMMNPVKLSGESQGIKIECAFQYTDDYQENTMSFIVWQGLDRTQDQSVNSFVTFSEGFRNMQNEEVIIDASNYKNYAVVIGNGKYEDGNQIEVDVDLSGGGYKKYLYVDQTGQTFDSTKQTRAEYNALLYQAGLEELNKYTDITNVTFDTIDRGLTYLEDYDLGDKCDVILDSVQQSFTVRIIEIQEVFKEAKHSVTLVFGEKVPTLYNKARR